MQSWRSFSSIFQHQNTKCVIQFNKSINVSDQTKSSILMFKFYISNYSFHIRPNSVNKWSESTASSGCADESHWLQLLLCLPSFIFYQTATVFFILLTEMSSEWEFLKTCFIFSPLLLSPSTILTPSLPRPPSRIAPCLACPAIAPLLCGLSFVSPAGYSFVPPSSAPFWSGTGIASLSVCLSNTRFLSFLSCWRLLSMLAVAQCIHTIAWIAAFCHCTISPVPSSCAHTCHPLWRIGTVCFCNACMFFLYAFLHGKCGEREAETVEKGVFWGEFGVCLLVCVCLSK